MVDQMSRPDETGCGSGPTKSLVRAMGLTCFDWFARVLLVSKKERAGHNGVVPV